MVQKMGGKVVEMFSNSSWSWAKFKESWKLEILECRNI